MITSMIVVIALTATDEFSEVSSLLLVQFCCCIVLRASIEISREGVKVSSFHYREFVCMLKEKVHS